MEFLTPELREAMAMLPERRRNQVAELRLRAGSRAKLVMPWGEELLMGPRGPVLVTDKLLSELLDRATHYSPYTLRGEESGLYLPLEGGCRMGLCGEASMQNGQLQGLRHVSSMVLRFAREVPGVAQGAADKLMQSGGVGSCLIVSPPGGGKTTFLRDLIRCVSQQGWRVSVADERRELAAGKNGVPQMDLGPCTDVLSGCPKAQAIPMLLRVMNPQVLAFDELAGQEELAMAYEAACCGVAVFATAHGDSLRSLLARPGYGTLTAAFDWCVTLKTFDTYRMERLGEYAEDRGSLLCGGGITDERMGRPAGHEVAAWPPAAATAGPGADAGGDGAAYAHCGRAV